MKILVIEDHADLREIMAELLYLYNYDVLLADNGYAGLLMAQNEQPALVLSDIQMPGMDGYTLLKHLRDDDRTQDIPVILTSAGFDLNKIQSPETGANLCWLSKPFDDTALLLAIRQILNL